MMALIGKITECGSMKSDKYYVSYRNGCYHKITFKNTLRGKKRKMKLYHGGYYNHKEEKWQLKYRHYFNLAIWHNPLYQNC